jgi:Protein of unknown function (DUF2752)
MSGARGDGARYRSPHEQRLHAWLNDDHTLGARLFRVALVFSPLAVAMATGLTVCPSGALGIPCPGCGLTRATFALISGDFAGATALQPLALVVCPLLAGALLYATARYVLTGRVSPQRWGAAPILIASMLALTVVWVVRWFGYFGGPVPV